VHRGKLSILGCKSGRRFSVRICRALENIYKREGIEWETVAIPLTEVRFSNGEIKTVINGHVRGADVYAIQCMCDPLSVRSINDNLMALLTSVNAAHQSDAEHITAVIPYFPYSRQERKKTREAITAAQVARFLEASGVDRVLTLDVHAEAIAGFFRSATLEDLHASRVLIDEFQHIYAPSDVERELVVVSPDVGSANRARFFSQALESDLAIADKERNYSESGSIVSVRLVGDVTGKDVLMVDDMIDTGGSIEATCRLLKEVGAEDIYIACSFPFLNPPATQRIDDLYRKGYLKYLIGTDAVFRGKKFAERHPWYREVSVAALFAEVIYRINSKMSVSELLK